MAISKRVCALIALLTCASLAHAQSSTTSSSAAAATIYNSSSKWEYVGCQNETTLTNGTNGARALSGGTTEATDTMTVDTCLDFCSSGGYMYAGLEYTRECYCAQLLSALSNKLQDSSCDLACEGNNTQICGGSLALTVYKAKSSSQGAGIKLQQSPMSSSALALGIALVVLLCLA